MAIRSLKSGSFSRSTQVGNSIILPGDYESIATVTLNSDSTAVSFSSIPSTFTHLQLRYLAGDATGAGENYYLRFNGDTAYASYTYHTLNGNGTSTASSGYNNTNTWLRGVPIGNNIIASSANTFVAGVADILDYTNTNKYKTTKALSGVDNNTTGRVGLYSGVWMNTSAITSISILTDASANFKANSKFALYGIRG